MKGLEANSPLSRPPRKKEIGGRRDLADPCPNSLATSENTSVQHVPAFAITLEPQHLSGPLDSADSTMSAGDASSEREVRTHPIHPASLDSRDLRRLPRRRRRVWRLAPGQSPTRRRRGVSMDGYREQ